MSFKEPALTWSSLERMQRWFPRAAHAAVAGNAHRENVLCARFEVGCRVERKWRVPNFVHCQAGASYGVIEYFGAIEVDFRFGINRTKIQNDMLVTVEVRWNRESLAIPRGAFIIGEALAFQPLS